ncbi:MAG: penicillin-binding protein activator, partial [Ruminococcus sp.]|nr:penicillin-binding protein activator [Ruminococcus sp.]
CNEAEQTNAETQMTESETAPVQENIIKIGVIESMSGEHSICGNQELLGIKFANKNKSSVTIGEDKFKIELEIIDDKSSYKSAKQAAGKLISSGVSAIIGSYSSTQTQAIINVLSDLKANIPVISANCTSMNLTDQNGILFRICPQDSYQAEQLANYAYNRLCVKKVCVITESGNDDSQTLAYLFAQQFKKSGGVVVNASFDKNSKDFSVILNDAKKQGCKLIFAPIPIYYSEDIISQLYEAKLNVPILSNYNWDSHVSLEAAWNYDTELYVSSFSKEDAQNEFYYNIQEWINNNADALKLNAGKLTISSATVLGYDAYNLLVQAITKAEATDSSGVLKSLKNISFSGVSGKIEFNDSAIIKRKSLFMKKADIVNDVWQYVDM